MNEEGREMKDWIYDEFDHVGVDYSQKENADIYDDQMESFRDYKDEAKVFIEKLGAANPKALTVIDIGCGTGAFAIHAAKYLKKVYAVDVSEEMLNIAKSKAKVRGIDNIEFCNSGFLQFQVSPKVDVVFSKWAFHHLPDYWKQAALLNINNMLKMNGIFLLIDVVFRFDPDYEKNTEAMINGLSNSFSEELIKETKVHIRDEYSTFDWILRGLIERAGFCIEKINAEDSLASEYFCRKFRSF
jgi:ubiquinone/menaquinone biosynthesis C-methylase UbiE